MEEMGKAVTRQRVKPELIKVGNREIASHGRWNDDLMCSYVLLHGRQRWIEVRELARTAYGLGSPKNQDAVRRYLYKLFNRLLAHNEILVVEYSGRRSAAVKVFDPHSDIDRQTFRQKLERMRARNSLSSAQYEQALLTLQDKECQ